MAETKSCWGVILRIILGAVLGTVGGAMIGAIVCWFLGAALWTIMYNPNAYHSGEGSLSYMAFMFGFYGGLWGAFVGLLVGLIRGAMYWYT